MRQHGKGLVCSDIAENIRSHAVLILLCLNGVRARHFGNVILLVWPNRENRCRPLKRYASYGEVHSYGVLQDQQELHVYLFAICVLK